MYLATSGNGLGKSKEFENLDEAIKFVEKKNKTCKFKFRVYDVKKIKDGVYKINDIMFQ